MDRDARWALIHAAARAAEFAVRGVLVMWRRLSLDAKVITGLGVLNWLLLFQSHTVVMANRDEPVWTLFPGLAGPLYLFAVAVASVTYALRDLRSPSFGPRQRWRHLALLIFLFVVLPTIASIVLRATGKPYTYIHDGALMAEEAAKKLLAGQNPYTVDYLDTPLFYWPMVNNPALYHFTYFPLLFLVTVPPLAALNAWLGWYDERVLFLPAFLACLVAAAALTRGTTQRLAIVAAVALNPQFFPFVIEGRNDAFVLLFVLLCLVCLRANRLSLAGLALAVATATKLHATLLVPFVLVYLLARARPRGLRDAWRAIAPAALPFAVVNAVVFVPFLVWDWYSMYDDIVLYNAGASAWSYPIAGVGFSMVLHALGVIAYRTADFPFWVLELAAAVPIMIVSLRRLWREPSLSLAVFGYAATLLAFLFFGRYFQTSYLGYIVAAVIPAFFLADRAPRRITIASAPVPVPATAGE